MYLKYLGREQNGKEPPPPGYDCPELGIGTMKISNYD